MAELYLLSHQNRLAKRDRGKSVNYGWFHYGRSQGLVTLVGRKLLFPPLVLRPKFLLSGLQSLLFMSGYAIFEQTTELDLLTIKAVLESDVFFRYLNIKSKSYREGWKACTKHLIQDFSIPHLSADEKQALQAMGQTEREKMIEAKYSLS